MAKSKKVLKKPAPRTAVKSVKKTRSASRAANRRNWLSPGQVPQIESYTRKLRSFIDALADGVVDQSEVEAQEQRLVKLMQEVEPQLDDVLHARITELLCELTAYDTMQLLYTMHAQRPQTVFRG